LLTIIFYVRQQELVDEKEKYKKPKEKNGKLSLNGPLYPK